MQTTLKAIMQKDMTTLTPAEADILRHAQGFRDTWPSRKSLDNQKPDVWAFPVKVDRYRTLALLQLEHEAEYWLAEDNRPDPLSEVPAETAVIPEPDEDDEDDRPWTPPAETDLAAYRTLVRDRMAKELWALRRIVQTRRGPARAGMRELFKLRRHEAFARRGPCADCKPSGALSCTHRTEMQTWLGRACAAMLKSPNQPWALAYFVLLGRELVRHYYDSGHAMAGVVKEVHENGDKRVHEGSSRDVYLVGRSTWVQNEETGEYEEVALNARDMQVVSPSDSTARGALDLMGWDRPSSFPTKTLRMAFCPACAAADGSPWFRVKRKKTATGYEQPPYALTEHCTNPVSVETGLPISSRLMALLGDAAPPTRPCGTLESEPEPRVDKVIRFRVTYERCIDRKPQPAVHEFYRSRGRWHWAKDHTRCHVTLQNELRRRYAAKDATSPLKAL